MPLIAIVAALAFGIPLVFVGANAIQDIGSALTSTAVAGIIAFIALQLLF